MTFLRAVWVGDIVAIHTEMLAEGTTSMTIAVEAWVTRMPAGDRMRVTEAEFVFVAVDAHGVKRPLPERT
jgi:acyl-CoA thioesterase YciA